MERRKTKSDIITEITTSCKFGVTNGFTQPIINRINMLSTGIRTDGDKNMVLA
jgi:Cu(I)/Ag(I) efflux system membrane protein CusA/SilA